MENKGVKFNSLTPDILEENKQVYTDAFDYAFSNDDIKNIAITGIYGAGKSTVWNTYKKYRLNSNNYTTSKDSFKNVITVSIGGYEYYSKTEDNKDEEILKSIDWKDYQIEKIIIKQILSQIKYDQIPLANNKFKKNRSKKDIRWDIFLTCLFFLSILSWFSKDFIASVTQHMLGNANSILLTLFLNLLFIFPVWFFLSRLYPTNKISFSTIKFQGAEANFDKNNTEDDELEKNSKEIVYLLASSNTTVVVFEDLDRFSNSVIFTKLKELNYLLNAYLNTNDTDRVVKFVYLIKDGLFYSKDRTKFFDFIIPIVPIVDSNTSVDKFIELFGKGIKAPDTLVLKKISFYVDDMRIIRNIVNEYTIYASILPMDEMKLDHNKLFSLITLKNTFPNEYQLLQEDRGYIKYVIKKLEDCRERLLGEIHEDFNQLNYKLDDLEKN